MGEQRLLLGTANVICGLYARGLWLQSRSIGVLSEAREPVKGKPNRERSARAYEDQGLSYAGVGVPMTYVEWLLKDRSSAVHRIAVVSMLVSIGAVLAPPRTLSLLALGRLVCAKLNVSPFQTEEEYRKLLSPQEDATVVEGSVVTLLAHSGLQPTFVVADSPERLPASPDVDSGPGMPQGEPGTYSFTSMQAATHPGTVYWTVTFAHAQRLRRSVGHRDRYHAAPQVGDRALVLEPERRATRGTKSPATTGGSRGRELRRPPPLRHPSGAHDPQRSGSSTGREPDPRAP